MTSPRLLPRVIFNRHSSYWQGEERIHCTCCDEPILVSKLHLFPLTDEGFCLSCVRGDFEPKIIKLLSKKPSRKIVKTIATVEPPSNNMGAENICSLAPVSNRVLIDWFAFTVPVSDPLEAIEKSGLKSMEFIEGHGSMGYKKSLRCGNVVVFFDGAENMGCHVSLTGQGCRQYEAYVAKSNCWYDLMHRVEAIGAHATRIDYAIDNVDGALDLDKLKDAVDSKDVRSRFRGGQEVKNFTFSREDTDDQGRTIYMGAKTSRIKIRFYDKAAQMKLDTHWVRCEIQCMAERAQESIKHLLKNVEIGELAVAILNNYFAPINSESINKSQCTMQSWWESWLITTEKIRLSVAKAIKEVDEVMDFLKRQYSPTFAMVKKYLGVARFSDFMSEMIDNGKERMGTRHEMMLACSNLPTEPALYLPF